MSRLASRPIPLSPSLHQLPLAYRRQLSVRMKALREYRQGCLLFVLPDYLRKSIVDWTLENIPDFHLADGGRELRPHITVVYGFDDDVGGQVKQFLQDTKPFSVRLTDLGVFPEGKDGVPFFARVESPELQRLHYSVMDAFGVEDKHPNYQPHITLGYLRPEVAESYLKGKPPFLPSMVTLDQLEFSTADNHVTSIPLSVLPLLGQKSLPYEGKGIVEKPDKLGRRNCYDDQTGKRVPCPKKEGEAKPRQKKPAKPEERYDDSEMAKVAHVESIGSREQIKVSLKTSKVVKSTKLSGGSNVVMIVDMEDGGKGIFKPAKGESRKLRGAIRPGTLYLREYASSRIGEILGLTNLVPATEIRSIGGKDGSVQEFVADAQTGFDSRGAYGSDEDRIRAAAFDFVICNMDRHSGNWLIKDGRLKLIDNGASFPDYPDKNSPYSGMYSSILIKHDFGQTEIPSEIKEWVLKEDDILKVLRDVGLSEGALEFTRQRLHTLKKAKTFEDLYDSLATGSYKRKGHTPTS